MKKEETWWRCSKCGDINPIGCGKCHCGALESEILSELKEREEYVKAEKREARAFWLRIALHIAIPIVVSAMIILFLAKPAREFLMIHRCGYPSEAEWNVHSYNVEKDTYVYFSEVGCNIILYAILPLAAIFWSYMAYNDRIGLSIIGYIATVAVCLVIGWFFCHIIGIIIALAVFGLILAGVFGIFGIIGGDAKPVDWLEAERRSEEVKRRIIHDARENGTAYVHMNYYEDEDGHYHEGDPMLAIPGEPTDYYVREEEDDE